jgi:hypothetical protein
VMFTSFHSWGTKLWHIDELNIIVISFDIVALSSLSILVWRPSGQHDLFTSRFCNNLIFHFHWKFSVCIPAWHL